MAYGPQIIAAAQRHGLSATLLAAVAAQETGGPGATSGANVVGDGGHGHGLFQIDDRYHTFAATPAAMDPGQNADYAAGLLSGLIRKFGGDTHAALSAYNAGAPAATGTVTTWADGRKLGYADSVLAHEAQLEGTARDAAMPELAETAAGVNALQSLNSAALTPTAEDAAISAAMPVSPLPSPPAPQTSQQQVQAQAPLTQDYYADAADGDDSKGA